MNAIHARSQLRYWPTLGRNEPLVYLIGLYWTMIRRPVGVLGPKIPKAATPLVVPT